MRQRYVFDRFLARLRVQFGDRVILKGGVVLEMRLGRARTTHDIDVRITGNSALLIAELHRAAAQFALDGDFLEFTVESDPKHPILDGDGVAYEGQRFRAEAKLANKIYGSRFGVDVAFGDRMAHPPEIVVGGNEFEFAGIPPIRVLAYAREVHLAEKLHALTMPRARENSRVKDLPDLALLGMTGPFQAQAVRDAILATFNQRSTHPPPGALPAPPERWAVPYAHMARTDRLRWATLDAVAEAARAFVDPVLAGEHGVWVPDRWCWEKPPT